MKEIVICAAIKLRDGGIIRGHRHSDCLKTGALMGLPVITRIELIRGRTEGFITSRNRFVDRKEGYRLQILAGIKSVNPEGYLFGQELYSEDLY